MLTSRLLYSLVPVMNIKAPTLAFWSFSFPPPAPHPHDASSQAVPIPPPTLKLPVLCGVFPLLLHPLILSPCFFSAPKASVILLYPFVPEREPWLLWTSQMPLIIIFFLSHLQYTFLSTAPTERSSLVVSLCPTFMSLGTCYNSLAPAP